MQVKLLIAVFALGFVAQIEAANLVCYWGSWSVYRPAPGTFTTANIDPFMCTHNNYGFAGLDPNTNTVRVLDSWCDLTAAEGGGLANYQNFNNLKNVNPNLKTFISIGGWNEGSTSYSNMAADPAKRSTFINSVVQFCDHHGFSGMDLDWEYPTQRGGVPADKQNYVTLLQELRTAFNAHSPPLLLTVAISGGHSTIDAAYDLPAICNAVDFVNVMSYDYQSWSTTNMLAHHCPLHSKPGEQYPETNCEWSINYLISLGCPANKINMGLAGYGRSYTLATPGAHNINTDFNSGPGSAGTYTREAGTLSYYECCDKVNNQGWTQTVDPDYDVPYAYSNNEWVGYDQPSTLADKVDFAKSKGLGGVMYYEWSFDSCTISCGTEPQCSNLQAIKSRLW